MKELVFQVWKNCFQHAANGYLVMHSPWGIFDIPIAFLDPENVDFDVLYAILLTFWITSLCVFVLMSAILENGAVCESHAFPTMSSRSFVIPTPQWLVLDMQTNVGIRLPAGIVSSWNARERRSQSYFDSGNGVPRNTRGRPHII